MTATTIYTIYTADEKVTVHHLLKHLKSKNIDDEVKIWYDDFIKSGQAWKPGDKSRLHEADIFILLIGNTFMYSEFIKQLEFKIIIDRYKAGTSKVIPVILENCPWDIDFEADDYTFNLNELTVLPEVGKPVRNWESPDEALRTSASYIKEIISSAKEKQERDKSESPKKKVQTEDAKDQLAISFSEEAEAKRKIAEEIRIKAETARKEAEDQEKRRAEEIWFSERMNAELKTVGVGQTKFPEDDYVVQQSESSKKRKRLLLVVAVSVLAIAAITFFYRGTNELEELSPQLEKEVVVVNDGGDEDDKANKESRSTTLGAGGSLAKLSTGDRYKNGIIFKIDESGKNGLVAHDKDVGPMTWNEAMKIHEELGEGWRLPTLEELKLMYRTIGQGAGNNGKFTDGLYWSATPYDANQAKLIRFGDGNASFHYNSIGNFRKFSVRAVRDFGQ